VSIVLFPGVAEVAEEKSADEITLDDLVLRQQELISRWHDLGSEFKRRVDGIPFDLALELSDLLCKYLE
jgi:hypothetical protein